MRTLRLPERAYNTWLLDEQFQQLTPHFRGISGVRDGAGGWLKDTQGNPVYVAELADDAPIELDAQIVAIAQAHDPNALSPVQQELIAHQADLAAVRLSQIQTALDQIDADLTTLQASPTNAQVLAIVGRLLQRQRVIIKALARLVDRG